AAGLAGIILVGLRGWIDVTTEVADAIQAIVGAIGLIGVIFALVNASKEKFGMSLISIVAPIAGIPSAFRLGKPHSRWAKLFYKHDRQKESETGYAGERGRPFWKRGGELLGRLGLGGPRRAGQN